MENNIEQFIKAFEGFLNDCNSHTISNADEGHNPSNERNNIRPKSYNTDIDKSKQLKK